MARRRADSAAAERSGNSASVSAFSEGGAGNASRVLGPMIVETRLRPKTRIQNPEEIFCCSPSVLQFLVFVEGSCDESGDEIEDPND